MILAQTNPPPLCQPLPQGFQRLQSRFPRQLECDKEAFVRAVGELKASDRGDPIHFRRAFAL